MSNKTELKFKAIEDGFISALREIGIELSPTAVCSVQGSSIELGIAATGVYKDRGWLMEFGSGITLYPTSRWGENKMSPGGSVAFTNDNMAKYWRTIHAASILKNWDAAFELVAKYCKMYDELIEEVKKNE